MKYNIYCDESCHLQHDGNDIMVIGGVFCLKHKVGRINKDIRKLKEKYEGEIFYLDAMKSPIKRIQDKFRYQIIIRMKLDKADQIEKEVFDIVDKASKTSVFFEVNPQNMS